ncbi:GntP family gluconate:H+ symporter [Rhizomicrobium palustre]|uniref:GntP family gluconate:H+ symporter n=1 Tax=Rhizomicrobium palustre TaxID=189966 RepID=A0A846MYP8_9PROT|nr:gluconate:H+ symporter [Rhizomicrobium palustre]NIK88369.1 GntP family gluconate:H+ symporter [Rhizomicrobium palustre]
MLTADVQLALAAVFGVALAILMIVRGRFHPFVALLCGAFVIGPLSGLSLIDTEKAIQKGAGDVLGSIGLVVALGLALGTMLQISGGASALARWMIGRPEARRAPWMSLAVALIIGLPLFFETGLVLLLPIIAGAVAALPQGEKRDYLLLTITLSALTGLSVTHALIVPHPGPLLAVATLHADVGRTMLLGMLVALPTAILAGPLLSLFTAKGLRLSMPTLVAQAETIAAPPTIRALIVVLLPVVLIASGQLHAIFPKSAFAAWVSAASNPVFALLLACLVALPLLFGRQLRKAQLHELIWSETMKPVGTILLSIAAGGALKQVLVSAGMSDVLARLAAQGSLSPIILAWAIAVAIRLATGSATVATITAAGVMPGVVVSTGVSPEWVVLAIGSGSVFFSHVNDPGFWLVKSYLGTSTPATFRTWSVLETVISLCGLALVLVFSRLI